MPPPVSSGLDFISALNAASQAPHQGGEGRDLPDGFPVPQMQGHRIIDSTKEEGIEGVSAYDYASHRRVFLIYRPWNACPRCSDDLATQKVSLPDDGDITCPHTSLREYKETKDRALAGQLIWGAEQETTQRDGTIVVSAVWYESKINHKRKRALEKQLERNVAVTTSEDEEP